MIFFLVASTPAQIAFRKGYRVQIGGDLIPEGESCERVFLGECWRKERGRKENSGEEVVAQKE